MHRRLLVLALTLAVAIGAAPSPDRSTAADGGATLRPVLLGLLGGRERFGGLTGQHTRVGHVIAGFGQGPVSNILAAMGEVPMLGIQSGGSLNSLDVAHGRGDSWFAEVNQAVAAHGGLVYIRPFPEMNGHWNAYCAYNQDGSPRGASNSTAAYVVANDLDNIRGSAAWAANDQLYAAHPSKPYAIAEWANWGFDDPGFVTRMADFVRTHRRVELLAYYNGRPNSPWDIAHQPRSRAAYRKLVVPLRR